MVCTLVVCQSGYAMCKKAIVEICLVPESEIASNEAIELDIKQTLKCSWLAQVEKVTVKSKT